MKTQRLVVAISGSSGAILGIRLLEILRSMPIETHLVVTPSARLTIEQETGWKAPDVFALADVHHSHQNMGASIASGSFETLGMIVIPCSIKSLSAVANSYSNDLLSRAADVTLKEGRPLILVLREAPLHSGHIRLMRQAAQAGAIIFPPVPAFYTHPQSVDEIVDNIAGRVLRRIGIENSAYQQWSLLKAANKQNTLTNKEPQHAVLSLSDASIDDLWNLPAMTLATSGSDGSPYAATVYFACSQYQELYFFSSAQSQHSINLAANLRAAATIYPLVDRWQSIRGLQLRGEAHPVHPGTEWDAAWNLYMKKFPFAGELKEAIAGNHLYVFQPDWIRLIDNQRGFGFKEEWGQI